MTTTKRYPSEPHLLTFDDFVDIEPDATYVERVEHKCTNCGTDLGHIDEDFVQFWRDAATLDDDVWCDACVDEPFEEEA
jgi:hypothetical protein